MARDNGPARPALPRAVEKQARGAQLTLMQLGLGLGRLRGCSGRIQGPKPWRWIQRLQTVRHRQSTTAAVTPRMMDMYGCMMVLAPEGTNVLMLYVKACWNKKSLLWMDSR
jgi:hypothetical protein